MADLSLSLKKTIDADGVRKLLEQSDWGQGRTTTQIQQQIHSSDIVFSVWEGTKMVAFARALTDYSYVVSIWDFIVDTKQQGKGVGSRLLKAILGHPDLIGVKKWTVFTPMNKEFFEGHSFEQSDEAMVRYG
ncbi:MAG TPA: GNAT family N-acetyltransferase [Candidatus Thermoplasmatota archaeon]